MPNILSKSRTEYLMHTIQAGHKYYNLFADLFQICSDSKRDLTVSGTQNGVLPRRKCACQETEDVSEEEAH
jgi:hypothetical protein